MIRLGAVGYLNARPLVYGLERVPGFAIRYDIPAECARLLHAHETDVGLIPSIEYLRGPEPYAIVPGAGVTSNGPVASVAIYTRREPRDIRTIAMDSSSRTSVALATVLLRREFGVSPEPVSMAPDLETMLDRADAALIIGDVALFLDHTTVRLKPDTTGDLVRLKPDTTYDDVVRLKADTTEDHVVRLKSATTGDDSIPREPEVALAGRSAKALAERPAPLIRKIDLGELWTHSTGLPFVYAVWTGWQGAVGPDDVTALQRARDQGVAHVGAVARMYYPDDPGRQAVAARYLRDNI
ncbi:MAG TPA: menaquinone biosynthesis protein, partial [Vicinamibacterales bacterium]|nr:menaquinone biosynthesis protein [Vicinamibacterales bacterium]